MQDGTKSVSDVFNGLLKQLALDEFPSGNGNWVCIYIFFSVSLV